MGDLLEGDSHGARDSSLEDDNHEERQSTEEVGKRKRPGKVTMVGFFST